MGDDDDGVVDVVVRHSNHDVVGLTGCGDGGVGDVPIALMLSLVVTVDVLSLVSVTMVWSYMLRVFMVRVHCVMLAMLMMVVVMMVLIVTHVLIVTFMLFIMSC